LLDAKCSLRGVALLLLAALGSCSDEGDNNNPGTTHDAGTDGGNGDAGDAQVASDAGDAATDAGDAATDAGRDAGDAATDAGKPDSGDELAAAMVTTGIRADRRRAELLAPPFCAVSISCAAMSPPTQAECESALLSDYDLLVESGDSPNCIDATLDTASCMAMGGSCSEAIARCASSAAERDQRCGEN
jgi:hypothetical protein